VADAMLGRLAKWLRMMGYDVVFMPDVPDLEVLRRARADQRLLLTRDTDLARRAGTLAVFVQGQSLTEQLAELATRGVIEGPLDETRCPICNAVLVSLPRGAARDRVPPYVYQTQSTFFECPQCGRVYWAGTHWKNVQTTLQELGWEEDM